MSHFKQTPQAPSVTGGKTHEATGPVVLFAEKRITLSGAISTRKEAEDFVATINALKAMLKEEEAPAQANVKPNQQKFQSMEESMKSREEALKEAGVELTAVSEIETLVQVFNDSNSFSGYGEFTPITVRSDTVLSDADMERNKR